MSVTRTFTVTVVSTGSGNKYFIDGVQQDTVNLAEGFTYKFDQSDSSNAAHPLRFSTTSNGTHSGGSEYTTGVTKSGIPTPIGTAGAFIQIVVADDAPQLFYYSPNDTGAGGKIEVVSRNTILTDVGDNILLNGTSVNKDRLLIETPTVNFLPFSLFFLITSSDFIEEI